MASPSILVVDDDPSMLSAAQRSLEALDVSVRTAASAEEALSLLAAAPAEVVLSDYAMTGMDGVELLRRVRQLAPHSQRVLVTGAEDLRAIEEANLEGAVDRYLRKPWEPAALRIVVRSALAQESLDRENEELHKLAALRQQDLQAMNASLEERVRTRTDQLARAKLEWERSFDAISDPVAIVSRERVVRRANLAWAAAGKRDIRSVPGQRCHEALFGNAQACDGCPLDLMSSGSAQSRIAVRGRSFRVTAYPLGSEEAVCTYRDTTAEEEAERQLVRSAKLTAAGQLAAGVAHEINNPLASILAFSQIMRDEPGRSPEDLEALKLVTSAALRGKMIVEALLRFVRKTPESQRAPVDLNLVVDEAAALMRPQIKGLQVTLDVEHPREQTWIDGNANQLAQVCINLLQNAVHAVGLKGRIVIACGVSVSGEHVFLSVEDDGPGIAPDVRAHLFEPFFTTKAEGVGTGLGLSIVHRIVEEHGGGIQIDSEPGSGATFTILLPPLK